MRAKLILFALLALGASAPAMADGLPQLTEQFGTCAVARDPSGSLEFVSTPIDSAQFAGVMKRVVTRDCLDLGGLQLQPLILRGSVFAALYKRDFRQAAPDLKLVPMVEYSAGYATPLSDAASNTVGLARLGDCIVRADAGAARELILNHPETPAEKRAIGQIAAVMPACIEKGRTIGFSRDMIRASVAEALYRLTAQAVAPGAPR
jgi:hypothetical protein